jgi:hypothetical protein
MPYHEKIQDFIISLRQDMYAIHLAPYTSTQI